MAPKKRGDPNEAQRPIALQSCHHKISNISFRLSIAAHHYLSLPSSPATHPDPPPRAATSASASASASASTSTSTSAAPAPAPAPADAARKRTSTWCEDAELWSLEQAQQPFAARDSRDAAVCRLACICVWSSPWLRLGLGRCK